MAYTTHMNNGAHWYLMDAMAKEGRLKMQVLYDQSWHDVICRARTHKGFIRTYRALMKQVGAVGYRLFEEHEHHLGRPS